MADRKGPPRWWAAVAVAMSAMAVVAPTAHADPAGPTDYRSEVVAIDPPTPAIDASVIGGDAFFELDVDAGTEVFVLGYENEEYLWFRADGEVFENRNSPATYLNGSRFGDGAIPADVAPDTEPDWQRVSSGGSWVWHDHRAHWMQESSPVAFERGDRIIDASIPLVVDGAPVDVRVVSTWQPEPSPWPVWLGAVAGLATVAMAWLLRRRGAAAVTALVPATLLALTVGAWQFRSLPAATGPRPVWVVLPAIAVVCAVTGVVAGRRGTTFVSDAAALVVGVELAVWGYVKREGWSAAIVPTDAPMWLDRFTTALALTGGVAASISALWWLFAATGVRPVSDPTAPTDSPRPAHP